MRANVLKIPNKVSPQNISENNSIEMENAIRNKKKREKSSDNNNNNNKYSNHHDKSSYNNEELVEMVASRHNHLNVPRYCVPDSGYIEPAPNTDSTLDPKELRWARIKFKEYESSAKRTNWESAKNKAKQVGFKFNMLTQRIEKVLPWYNYLKEIEKTFGSSHLSFFKFVQWLLLFNLFIGLISIVFLVLPQALYSDTNESMFYNDSYLESNNFTLAEACPSILYNLSIITSNNLTNDEYLKTECCSFDYKNYLDNLIKNASTWTKFLDIVQGTGILENTILFYGHYNNHTVLKGKVNEKPVKHVYYMGLAFVLVTLAALFFSAISMLFRLGNGLKTAIIKSNDSGGSELCKQIFCSWDYRLSDKRFPKYLKKSIYRFLKAEIEEIKSKNFTKMGIKEKIILYTKRFVILLLILVLFGGSGYAIYLLTDFSIKALLKSRSDTEKLLFEFLPAIGIKFLNFTFPFICYYLAKFERYSVELSLTFYLLRTGVVRLGSIIFLFISITVNIYSNPGFCSSQKDSLFADSFTNEDLKNTSAPIKCWETYVGQQFYKLIVLDFIIQIVMVLVIEFPITKLQNKCFSWLGILVPTFDPGVKFLDILYVQTIFWLAFFFSPLLNIIAAIYYLITLYLKIFSLWHASKPLETEKIRSRSNVAFFFVLFLVFLLVLITVGLLFSAVKPSRSCGPFRLHNTEDFYIYKTIVNDLNNNAPTEIKYIFNFLLSYISIFLISVLLIILIWILNRYSKAQISMAGAFRKIVTEERNKNNTLLKEVSRQEKQLLKLKSKYNIMI